MLIKPYFIYGKPLLGMLGMLGMLQSLDMLNILNPSVHK